MFVTGRFTAVQIAPFNCLEPRTFRTGRSCRPAASGGADAREPDADDQRIDMFYGATVAAPAVARSRYLPSTVSTARLIASAPVLIDGSGTGAKKGEWLNGSGLPPGCIDAATTFGSETPTKKNMPGTPWLR